MPRDEPARPPHAEAFVNTEPVGRRVTCPTFVGRDAELSVLWQAVDAARRETQFVLVGGDAGVGKTRLLDELCRRVVADGGVVAVGGCVDVGDVGIGYGPLVEVLRRLRASLGADVVDGLLTDVAPELRPLSAAGGHRDDVRSGAVLEQTMALLDALGERSPGLVVAIEDLHWADASTRDLVASFARHLRAAKVLLVMTYRADDVHRRHPVRPLLSELTRSPAVEHVRMAGMTRSELTLLMSGITGRIPADSTVDAVMARSEGNPFYAEELVAARAGTGALPDTVRDAILTRVAGLPESVQTALREAALIGGTVDDRLLATVAGRPIDEIGAALREALEHQVLVLERDGCRFRHALVREALYDELLPGERQRLHEAAAAALEAHPELAAGPEHVRWALLAYHWSAADERPKAFAASVRAGLEAEQIGASADAAAHFERALGLWANVADAEALAGMDQPALLLHAAAAYDGHGAFSRAVGLVESAVSLLDADAEPERLAATLERLGHHRWAAGDEAGTRAARERAAELVEGRPPSRIQALALFALGRQLMVEARYVEAEPALRTAIAAAEATGAQGVRATALGAMSIVLTSLGREDEGLAAGDEAVRTVVAHGTVDDINLVYVNVSDAYSIAGRFEESIRLAGLGLEHARRFGMLASGGALLTGYVASANFLLGRWDDALAAIAANHRVGGGKFDTDSAAVASSIALLRGRLDDAAGHADHRLALDPAGTHSAGLICKAEVAAARGAFGDARRLAAAAFEAAIVTTENVTWIAVVAQVAIAIEADRIEAARLKGRRGDPEVEEAHAAADEVHTRAHRAIDRSVTAGFAVSPSTAAWLALADAHHARAHGRLDADQWADVAARFDAMSAVYEAAVARYHEADARLRSRSGHDLAATAARRALATAEQLGAAPLAERIHLLAQRGRLDLSSSLEPAAADPDPFEDLGISAREGEVLHLLSLGRTNRQIADALYISEKTASVHVTHLLRKLGVANRVEASAIAQRLEWPDAT